MQKKVGDVLYVLDLTPYTITKDTDVSIIYVQNEQIKGYKELNTELASKIHGFNQFIMTVLPRPWADGGDEPEPTGHTFTLFGNDVHSHVDVYFNDVLQEMTGSWTNVVSGTSIQIKPKEGYTKEWFGGIQNAEWVDSYNAWFPIYEGNYGMPDTDLTVTIDYVGQPQPVLSWKYTPAGHDQSPTDFEMTNSFMKDPRALANLNGENPIMPELYINNVPSHETSDFTVTYSTPNKDLITVDQNGVISPVESSEGEYSYGFAAVYVNVHDNTGTYADALTISRLELIHCHPLTKSTAGAPGEIVDDPLILGDSDNGFTASDCPVRFVSAYKDGVPYICSPEEFDMCGVPEGSTISLWFDGDPSDITLKYREEGMSDYNPMTYDTNDHWITFTMPNHDLLWTAIWTDENVTVMSVTDDVGRHNGSNLPDEMGGWYYKFKYLSAPDSYTNEVKYGHDYEYLNYYGPNNFVFKCLDGNGTPVALEPIQGGYSFSMADDSAGNSYPGVINFFVTDPPFDGLTAYYNVQNETQPVTLLNRQAHTEASGHVELEYPTLVYIDGQLVYDASNSEATRIYEYTFNTPGQHVVKYSFANNYIPSELFYNINTISEIKIGESISEVKGAVSADSNNLLYSGAFFNCSGLTTVTMSDHISTIGASAFYGSTNLNEATIYATNPPTMGILGLGEPSNWSAIYVPGPSVTAYQNASGWSNYSSYITAITGTEEESGES